MDGEQFDALVAAAEDGVAFDGLRVEPIDEGYRFTVPGTDRSGLSEGELRDAAADHADRVTDWYFWTRLAPEEASRRAFLRWLERADDRDVSERYDALADGVARSWGQLRLTVTLGADGHRLYAVRHADDAGAALETLERHEDPRSARELAKRDARGRYRPLKTAPTLQKGWAFVDLSPREVLRTVDFLYPATVQNWHRERADELDVDHWTATAERQTGIYDVIDELDPTAVEWIAESCCVDSQCLKRREWDYDDEHELSAPRGDGTFPCREPCSLVVAAARKWTTLERENPREYTFELTPSEKEQLEALIDAVADGRTDEIREADVYEGANRYRARFLRAKRFDEEGRLCGVPTEPDGDDG